MAPVTPPALARATPPRWRRWVPAAAWAVALLALTLVSLAYLRPEFAVDLTNRFWSCF